MNLTSEGTQIWCKSASNEESKSDKLLAKYFSCPNKALLGEQNAPASKIEQGDDHNAESP